MKKRKENFTISIFVILSIIGVVFGVNYDNSKPVDNIIEEPLTSAEQMKIHYLDVDQGDSIFIELPTKETMLIDAGEANTASKTIDYIKKLNYQKIDYLVATHPHIDHIGGMTAIINEFDVGKIYMPKVSVGTKTYEKLLQTIADKDLKIKTAVSGVSIIDSDNLDVVVIAPNSTKYDEINNYSTVIKITYKENKFLFMGDAEVTSEEEITTDVKVDVLKVGHHGSDTSTSDAFLDKVNPSIAIISVGKDNSYGHPKKEILDKLQARDVKIYRTDINGTIVVASDGTKINVKVEK